jgi:hypothetical protein
VAGRRQSHLIDLSIHRSVSASSSTSRLFHGCAGAGNAIRRPGLRRDASRHAVPLPARAAGTPGRRRPPTGGRSTFSPVTTRHPPVPHPAAGTRHPGTGHPAETGGRWRQAARAAGRNRTRRPDVHVERAPAAPTRCTVAPTRCTRRRAPRRRGRLRARGGNMSAPRGSQDTALETGCRLPPAPPRRARRTAGSGLPGKPFHAMVAHASPSTPSRGMNAHFR